MDHPPGLGPVQPGVAVEGLGTVEIQHEVAVACLGEDSLVFVRAELRCLPGLALVFAKVLHGEGAYVRDGQESLPGGVDGEAADICGDPASVQLFGYSCGRAGAYKAIEDEVALVG